MSAARRTSHGVSAGVTLLEMLVVVALMGLMAGISYPSVSSGIDSLRLMQASDSIAALLNASLNRADRRQQVVEVTVSMKDNTIEARSAMPGFTRRLEMPEGVVIRAVRPDPPGLDREVPRRFLLFPGGSVPRIAVELSNRKGARRAVSVDPMTGVPEIATPEAER